jgi:hypothetical protein
MFTNDAFEAFAGISGEIYTSINRVSKSPGMCHQLKLQLIF